MIISSVNPSLKYSWLASPLKFRNGRTASMTLSLEALARGAKRGRAK
jgi:hypothetical protein